MAPWVSGMVLSSRFAGGKLKRLANVFVVQFRILLPQFLAIRIGGRPPRRLAARSIAEVADTRLAVKPCRIIGNSIKNHCRFLALTGLVSASSFALEKGMGCGRNARSLFRLKTGPHDRSFRHYCIAVFIRQQRHCLAGQSTIFLSYAVDFTKSISAFRCQPSDSWETAAPTKTMPPAPKAPDISDINISARNISRSSESERARPKCSARWIDNGRSTGLLTGIARNNDSWETARIQCKQKERQRRQAAERTTLRAGG